MKSGTSSAMKTDLVHKWSQLSVADQAELLITLQQLLRIDSENFIIPYKKLLLNREDLREVLTNEEVEQIDENDMGVIAQQLGAAYTETGMFWDDLELYTREILERKNAT